MSSDHTAATNSLRSHSSNKQPLCKQEFVSPVVIVHPASSNNSKRFPALTVADARTTTPPPPLEALAVFAVLGMTQAGGAIALRSPIIVIISSDASKKKRQKVLKAEGMHSRNLQSFRRDVGAYITGVGVLRVERYVDHRVWLGGLRLYERISIALLLLSPVALRRDKTQGQFFWLVLQELFDSRIPADHFHDEKTAMASEASVLLVPATFKSPCLLSCASTSPSLSCTQTNDVSHPISLGLHGHRDKTIVAAQEEIHTWSSVQFPSLTIHYSAPLL